MRPARQPNTARQPLPKRPVQPLTSRVRVRARVRVAVQADIAAVKEAMADDAVSADALKEKVEALKKSSMKIGEAVYKTAQASGGEGGGEGGGEKKADYEDVKKEGDKK